MIAFTFLILVVVYFGLIVVVGVKTQSWNTRLFGWGILLAWPAYEIGTYQSVRFEHERACEKEGGLKIFIQPEKTDRIRLDGKSFDERDAEGLLYRLWPRLQLVEAQDKTTGMLGTAYYSYTIDTNTVSLPKKDWKFNKIKVESLSADFYILSKSDEMLDKEAKHDRTIWRLTRNRKLFSQWTSLQDYWSTQGLFASMIGWRCFDMGTLADGKETHPDEVLTELVLK